MVDLIARTPADGLLPYTKGEVDLSEIALGTITSIAPFKGQDAGVAAALGVDLPKVGRSVSKSEQELVWVSQGQYFAIGAEPIVDLGASAAVSDQSDAWCALEIKGAASEAVLARLVPVDLRRSTFKRGHALRSQLGHMPLHITRTGNDSFRLLSFRSMAGTMVHDISRAMNLLARRR